MKRFMIPLLFVLLYFSACSTWHSGQITQMNTQSDQAMWLGKTAAQEQATYFFLIGGNKKDLVLSSLQNQLMLRYKDSTHLLLQNFTLNTKLQNLFFYSRVQYTLVADIYKNKQDVQALTMEPYYQYNDLHMREMLIPQERLSKSIQNNGPLRYQVNDKVFVLWNPPGRKSNNEIDTLNFVTNAMIPATLIELNSDFVKVVYMNPQTYKVEVKKMEYNQIYQDVPFTLQLKDRVVKRNEFMNILQLFGINSISQVQGTLLFYNSEKIVVKIGRPEGNRYITVPLGYLN